ncbi:MAG TPA: GNAT family N-acetyltransferase [Longimicrobium sp.]|nr:GNAT family N-acetyltransferase [Longimicrobium sp.]
MSEAPALPPTLTTERLLLRAFTADDAPATQEYVSSWELASTTAAIPHPYPPGAAKAWIDTHAVRHAGGEAVVLAVTLRESGELVGSIELRIADGHRRGDLGYWTGPPHWGRGYATEAADALVRWAFRDLGLHRVFAACFTRNPASGAVLRRIGMRHEGTLRSHVPRWGALEDLEVYGMLADELPAGAER